VAVRFELHKLVLPSAAPEGCSSRDLHLACGPASQETSAGGKASPARAKRAHQGSQGGGVVDDVGACQLLPDAMHRKYEAVHWSGSGGVVRLFSFRIYLKRPLGMRGRRGSKAKGCEAGLRFRINNQRTLDTGGLPGSDVKG